MLRLLRSIGARSDRLLDLGCGTGFTAAWLAQQGYEAIGIDRLHEGLRRPRNTARGARLVQADALSVPLRGSSMSTVLLLDVLEHVDDIAVIKEAWRLLGRGGWLIASVPAYPWLWSHRDEAAGHLRRYRRTELLERLRRAGFEVVATGGYQCLLLPVVILSRWLGRGGPQQRDREDAPSPLINKMLGWVTRLELAAGRWIRWPAGSTLYAVCRKP